MVHFYRNPLLLLSALVSNALLPAIADANQDVFSLQQPSGAPPPKTLPLRRIEWGQLNFISTTDTHGWLAGHLLQPSYAADWGDYTSFIEHIKETADEKGVDVIVVDDGDQHDGNGLSDATFPTGEVSQKILMMAPIDLMSIGNHELYQCEVTQQTYDMVAPHFDGRYLTSNVEIMLSNGSWVHIGQRSYRFTTKHQGINIMSFGFLFDFKLNCNNSRVSEVEDVVQQAWFQSAIREPGIDMFLVFGHYPIRFWPEMWAIHRAIRAVHKSIPIQYFGGHSHVRDFTVLDSRASALQAGRFLETVGWLSIEGIEPGKSEDSPDYAKPLKYSRRYLDFNPYSLSFHANKTLGPDGTFGTENGKAISKIIDNYRQELNLTYPFGCVPTDYLLEKAKYPGPNSLLSLMEDHVLQNLISDDKTLHGNSRLIFINSGSLRYDMYGGIFTVDSGYIVSPFDNAWLHIPSVPYSIAKKILAKLNALDHIFMELTTPISRTMTVRQQNLGDTFDINVMNSLLSTMSGPDDQEDLKTTGYVTIDDYGMDGDDTPHKPYPLYYLPNAITTEDAFPSDGSEPDRVDVVFLDFMKPFLLDALARIDSSTPMEEWKILEYGGKPVKELIKDYVRGWGTECLKDTR
ncbi:Metallo-dependent phosphatase-like protein [Lipomyces tetrasporus]|uniref:Metallo-dependent phosphatase-like protein n=1 Tax=Lipomyces tetrasporus TaxID=54092 RepID=A0AAD7QLP7_9ASCO|nr:Metallo-dependent phosphatase-like protein [Lipomyces tetrasporus]KAJ8097602.1 Metallo-dependent phosphatase-like protein [Lipomyces tetrasporus]